MDSEALTKIQSVVLIVIFVVAAVGGVAGYVFWRGNAQSAETIKIGVCADIDSFYGKAAWQGAVLAAEQVNAAGGVLGRNFEVVGEDDDTETMPLDIAVASSAFTKLITVEDADYIMSCLGGATLVYQDIAAQHKKSSFRSATLVTNSRSG